MRVQLEKCKREKTNFTLKILIKIHLSPSWINIEELYGLIISSCSKPLQEIEINF